MYHEIEGLLGIESMVFDDEELIVGSHHYPYSEIESLKITSAPFFASYGVMTLRTKGKDISIPFYRARKSKLEKALREFEKLRESGEIGGGAKAPDTQTDKVSTATSDPYEELKKLKELLDLNIITQEEFDAKKKKLLDL